MDLEIALYPVIEGLAPRSLPDNSINTLCHELAGLLKLPTKSINQLQTLLDSYKMQIPYSPGNILKWQNLLNVMQLMLNIEQTEEMVRYLSAFQSMLSENIPIQSNSLTRPSLPTLNMSGLETHDKLLSPLRPLSLQAESFENLDRLSDRRSLMSSQKGYALNRGYNSVTLDKLSDPYYAKMVSEEEILKFLPYTLLATTSDLFPVDLHQIKIPHNVPNADSGMLHLVFEAALLYQNLRWKVDQHRSSDISPMKKALIIQLEKELRSYTGFVNGLSASSRIVSLKLVYFELYDYITSLRFYDGFIRNFEDTTGDSFLSESSSLKTHGDLLVRRLCNDIFRNLLSLYYEYLINWLTLGKLDATYGEFFIMETNSDDPIPMQLDKDKLPGFIPSNVACEILMIGKTYIFLGKYCKELQWTNNMSKKYASRYRAIESNGIYAEFYDLVHEQYKEVVNFSNETLLRKLYYKQVIFALKDILLMGKSDLIDTLIHKASDVLTTPSASLSSYRLTRYLQEAVQQSSLRNLLNRDDSNYIINGLDARVLDLGHGSIGWDVFTLDYLIDAPLSIVLNVNRQNGKKEYLRIFNFLWRFKKNNYFYNEEWLRSNQLMKDFKKLYRHRPLVRDILTKLSKINVLRSQLQQFNLKLEAYCFRYIIDKNFQDFEQKLMLTNEANDQHNISTVTLKGGLRMLDSVLKPKTKVMDNASGTDCEELSKSFNIDELDMMHNQYLDAIISSKLLASSADKKVGNFSGQPYPTSLILLLNMVFEFITYYSAMNDVAHEVLIQLNLQSQQHQLNDLLKRFNSVLRNIVSHYKRFLDDSYVFMKDLRSDGDEDLAKLSRILR